MLCLSMPFGVILQDVRWSLQCFHYQCYAVSFAAVLCCAVLCCAVPSVPRCAVPCYVASSFNAVLFHAMLCRTLPCCSISCHTVSPIAMLQHFQTSCDFLCYGVAGYAMFCQSTQCCDLPVKLYHAVSCSAEVWASFALLPFLLFTAVPLEAMLCLCCDSPVGQQPLPAMLHTHLLLAITFLHRNTHIYTVS